MGIGVNLKSAGAGAVTEAGFIETNALVSGFGVRILYFLFMGSDFGMRISCFVFQGSGFRVQGSGFRVQCSEVRVEGSGYRGSGIHRHRRWARRRTPSMLRYRPGTPASRGAQ